MTEEQDQEPNSNPNRWSLMTQAAGKVLRRIWPILAALSFAFLGVFLYNRLYPAPIPLSENQLNQTIYDALASATPEASYSSRVFQTILPSIVYIQTKQESRNQETGFGVGSGVIINEAGDILTALHVVDNADEIQVFFVDGSQTTAEIITTEPETDIAIIHPAVPPELIVPAVLGNSGAMRVGDEAFAVGNPFGLVASMSAGVISGFDRSIPISDESDQHFEGLIQFDTAVNPGNSGGPLLNRQGQVIGIVTALANPADQPFFVGIGFAVPIGVAVSAGGGGPSY